MRSRTRLPPLQVLADLPPGVGQAARGSLDVRRSRSPGPGRRGAARSDLHPGFVRTGVLDARRGAGASAPDRPRPHRELPGSQNVTIRIERGGHAVDHFVPPRRGSRGVRSTTRPRSGRRRDEPDTFSTAAPPRGSRTPRRSSTSKKKRTCGRARARDARGRRSGHDLGGRGTGGRHGSRGAQRRRRIEELDRLERAGDPDLEVVFRQIRDGPVLPVEDEDVELEDVDVDARHDLGRARRRGRRAAAAAPAPDGEEPRKERGEEPAKERVQVGSFADRGEERVDPVCLALREWTAAGLQVLADDQVQEEGPNAVLPLGLEDAPDLLRRELDAGHRLQVLQKTVARERKEMMRMRRRTRAKPSGATSTRSLHLEQRTHIGKLQSRLRLGEISCGNDTPCRRRP